MRLDASAWLRLASKGSPACSESARSEAACAEVIGSPPSFRLSASFWARPSLAELCPALSGFIAATSSPFRLDFQRRLSGPARSLCRFGARLRSVRSKYRAGGDRRSRASKRARERKLFSPLDRHPDFAPLGSKLGNECTFRPAESTGTMARFSAARTTAANVQLP